MGYQLFGDHRPDGDGFCITCVPAKFVPCIGRDLALRGFLASLGLEDLALAVDGTTAAATSESGAKAEEKR
jgi:hypothetical protein